MSLDALNLISKVIDRAAQKATQAGPAAGLALDDEQRTELIVETLASHLLGFVGMGPNKTEPSEPDNLQRICDDQIARNRSLARALGACDCWGELPACDRCYGHGAAGWRRPDPQRFNTFVRPVVEKMNRHRIGAGAVRSVRGSRMAF